MRGLAPRPLRRSGSPAYHRGRRDVPVDPVDHGTVGVMVEREHVTTVSGPRRRPASGSSSPGGSSRRAGSRPIAPRPSSRPARPGTAMKAGCRRSSIRKAFVDEALCRTGPAARAASPRNPGGHAAYRPRGPAWARAAVDARALVRGGVDPEHGATAAAPVCVVDRVLASSAAQVRVRLPRPPARP